MKKNTYESPDLQVIYVTVEQTFLSNVERMNTIDGSWDEEDVLYAARKFKKFLDGDEDELEE